MFLSKVSKYCDSDKKKRDWKKINKLRNNLKLTKLWVERYEDSAGVD
jgi:hypothetical protein